MGRFLRIFSSLGHPAWPASGEYSWFPPNARDLRLDEPEPDITPTAIDPTEPAF